MLAVMCVCVLDSQRKRENAGNELWILIKNCSDGGGTTKLLLQSFTFKHEYYWHDGRWWRSSSSHSHSHVMYDDGILADSYTLDHIAGPQFWWSNDNDYVGISSFPTNTERACFSTVIHPKYLVKSHPPTCKLFPNSRSEQHIIYPRKWLERLCVASFSLQT